MSWKHDLQLRDLEPEQMIEVVCRRCGYAYYEQATKLLERGGFEFAWLDEVEKTLACPQWGCPGPVKLALSASNETEGFTGGLA